MKRTTIELVKLEATSLNADVKEIIYAATVQARMLSNIGATADQAALNCFGDAGAPELRACATRLRGAALHGLVVLAELQAQAGRLEQVASVREARVPDGEA